MMLTKRDPGLCDASDRVTCLYKAFHLKWSWIRSPPFHHPAVPSSFSFPGSYTTTSHATVFMCDWLLITEHLQCTTLCKCYFYLFMFLLLFGRHRFYFSSGWSVGCVALFYWFFSSGPLIRTPLCYRGTMRRPL